ncbi:MAG TPA: PAS domain S-box protein [Mucilaginibacter sp.]|jgi:PAS domain S-box-containing protein|nr:PAS domain S-box protein [Mucilaginibacter sp.]
MVYQKELIQAVGETILSYHTIIDKHGKYKFFGHAIRNLSGYNLDNLQGANVKDYIHAEDVSTVFNQLSNLPFDKTDILLPFRFRIADGSYKWIEASVTNMVNNPHVNGYLVNSKDITDVIEGIKKNKLINSSYANFFAKHPFGVIHINMDGTVDMINSKLTEDLGYNLTDIADRQLIDFFLPKYRRKIFHAFHKARMHGAPETFDVEVYTLANNALHVNLTIIPVTHQNETTELYLVVKNISDRVELQENLRKLSIVADKTTNGVVILDKEGNIEWVNNGFTQMNGYSMEEAHGKGISELLKSDMSSETRKNMLDHLKKGMSFTKEVACEKKDGTQYWILVEVTPVMDKNKKLVRRISIHTDITTRKAAETDLKLLADDLYKRNRELYQFSYVVSHNLRKPVANIMGITSLLESEKDDPQTVEICTQNLKTSIESLDEVIKDLSQILSATDGSTELTTESIDLNEMINNIQVSLKDMISQSGTHIETHFELSTIVSYKAYLYSTLYNLVSNAIKYRSGQPPLIKILVNVSDDAIYIVVSDNGAGIDLDKHSGDIFKPYRRFNFTTDGKGLGLFLVKSHIDAMGGKISIKSATGVGTTFNIMLPAVSNKQDQTGKYLAGSEKQSELVG